MDIAVFLVFAIHPNVIHLHGRRQIGVRHWTTQHTANGHIEQQILVSVKEPLGSVAIAWVVVGEGVHAVHTHDHLVRVPGHLVSVEVGAGCGLRGGLSYTAAAAVVSRCVHGAQHLLFVCDRKNLLFHDLDLTVGGPCASGAQHPDGGPSAMVQGSLDRISKQPQVQLALPRVIRRAELKF